MRKITLKQIRNNEINTPIKFRASPLRFQNIARAMNNTSIRWYSGHKPAEYGQDLVKASEYTMYYIDKNPLGNLLLSRGTDTYNTDYYERVSIR